MILPPTDQNPSLDTSDRPSAQPSTARATPITQTVHAPTQVLIPAGRGVYAHPMLALSSDQTSPVVLQADSGPIAGDRMIGSFARQNDRLILHVNTIIHENQNISCDTAW